MASAACCAACAACCSSGEFRSRANRSSRRASSSACRASSRCPPPPPALASRPMRSRISSWSRCIRSFSCCCRAANSFKRASTSSTSCCCDCCCAALCCCTVSYWFCLRSFSNSNRSARSSARCCWPPPPPPPPPCCCCCSSRSRNTASARCKCVIATCSGDTAADPRPPPSSASAFTIARPAESSCDLITAKFVSCSATPRVVRRSTSVATSSFKRPCAIANVVRSCRRRRSSILALSRTQLKVPATMSRCRCTS